MNPFYLLPTDTVQIAIVFAAIVESERVTLGSEHDKYEWISVAAAQKRLTWPRDVELVAVRAATAASGGCGRGGGCTASGAAEVSARAELRMRVSLSERDEFEKVSGSLRGERE